MGFLGFGRSRDTPERIPTGRRTKVTSLGRRTTLSSMKPRVDDVLEDLRAIPDEATAIEFLKRVTPDVSMAVWNFIRLANQGHEMAFYSVRNNKDRLADVEAKWREFAAMINEISNSGLDGLVDQFHYSAYVLGAMASEAEVIEDLTDIRDIYVVKPQTIEWKLEERNGREVWIPYQRQTMKNVSLEKGEANFYWVPTDPEIGDPRGTLILSPVLQAIDFQLEIMRDLQKVLHHQGWPRDDYSIIVERLMTYCPGHIKNRKDELMKWMQDQYDNIVANLKKLKADSDIVHFDDVVRTPTAGNANTRSLDVRAITETVDGQMMSGAKQLAIFMNRNTGITETWGTVQFRIFCSGINSVQRGSKRIVEEIARLWLRVNGIQASPVFTHNTIDWNSEEQRMTVNLMRQEFYAIAQLMGWIDKDEAAQEVMKKEKAVKDPPAETIRVSFNAGGNRNVRRDDGKGNAKKSTRTETEPDDE
jgi:hypothetical protein